MADMTTAKKTPAKKTATKKTTAKKTTKSTAKRTSAAFSDAEREAMADRAKEAKAERKGASAADGEKDVREKIAAMPDADRTLAERVHEIVLDVAPELVPRTWYGMPAYAKDGNVLCYFQNAGKFKARYSTLGFSDKANLDSGAMWPAAFALTEMTATAEKELRALVRKAVS